MSDDIVAAYARCRPLRDPEVAKLGVSPALLDFNPERKLFKVLAGAVAITGNRFEFMGTHIAIIFACLDETCDLVDLAAWRPAAKQLALWRGRVKMLGEENAVLPRLGESLAIHDTPLEWLQADRRGVVLIDAPASLSLLYAASPVSVSSSAVRSTLQSAWRSRFPDVRVRASARRESDADRPDADDLDGRRRCHLGHDAARGDQLAG